MKAVTKCSRALPPMWHGMRASNRCTATFADHFKSIRCRHLCNQISSPWSPPGGEGSSIKIDTTGLLRTGNRDIGPNNPNRTTETPLVPLIRTMIAGRGPLSCADYMKLCLSHPVYGYYTSKSHVIFGKSGDFVTSPEISQLFGEMVGVFLISRLMQRPKGLAWNIVECGPGKGTLLRDILRVVKRFPEFSATLNSIQLVETSKPLRSIQAKTLGAVAEEVSDPMEEGVTNIIEGKLCLSGDRSTPISWFNQISDIPSSEICTFVVAHELFDALPVHQFAYGVSGWRERLIDSDEGRGPHHIAMALAPNATPASAAYTAWRASHPWMEQPKPGDYGEFSPVSIALMRQIAELVQRSKGAALIVDYGDAAITKPTIRAIKSHKFVDLLEEPGEADLSADVDFGALYREVQESFPSLHRLGPVTQEYFLREMGIETRAQQLANGDVKELERLQGEVARLCNPEEMGDIYKFFGLEAIRGEMHGFPAD